MFHINIITGVSLVSLNVSLYNNTVLLVNEYFNVKIYLPQNINSPGSHTMKHYNSRYIRYDNCTFIIANFNNVFLLINPFDFSFNNVFHLISECIPFD